MTFGEGNNFSPRYSPDGKSFVYTHFINGKFYIAVQDFQTGPGANPHRRRLGEKTQLCT